MTIKRLNINLTDNKIKYNNTIEYSEFLKKEYKNYKFLEKEINIYNRRWDLSTFDKDDYQLFLGYSKILLLFTPKVISSSGYLNHIIPQYEKLKERIIVNNNLNFIEKSRIICGFAKFCSNILKNDIAPELIIMKELNENNPYKIAVEKYKKIIESMDESSGFFKKVLIFDNGADSIINEWDFSEYNIIRMIKGETGNFDDIYFENTKFSEFQLKFEEIKKKKITFPSLSMLSLNQIKEHLLDLLPKFLFITSHLSNFVALSDSVCCVSFFNQGILIKKLLDEKDLEIEHKKYTLPIMIEISHEFFSHLKSRYGNSCDSPILYPIKGKNNFLCQDNYENESGFAFEYFLCDNIKELKHLKTPNEKLFELCEKKYWINFDFTELREFNKKIMEENEINEEGKNESFNDDEFDFFSFDKRNKGLKNRIKCVF